MHAWTADGQGGSDRDVAALLWDRYRRVMAPPRRHAIITLRKAMICGIEPSTAFQPGVATPFEFGGNVVAKTAVGLGEPETVTVGTVSSVVGVVPLPWLLMANLDDEPNMTPDVELTNMMK